MEKIKEIEMAGPWITDLEVQYVTDALLNGWYGKDKYHYCEQLQKEFAAYHDRQFALMTPNCTSAIHLLVMALGIKDDDEVLVPECTWIASCAPLSYVRAKPVFVDIEPENWCICPNSVRDNITPKTKAIIAVDLFGNMPLMEELENISQEYNIPIIEDAAEALGSKYNGRRAGKFGIGSVFSFHRTKTMTTGEGGMLLTDDKALYERCAFLRDHGRHKSIPYYNTEAAYKYMPFNIQAALGYAQFQRLEELVGRKRQQFQWYKEKLKDISDIQFNNEPDNVYNSVWITSLVVGKSHNLNKKELMQRLTDLGCPSRPFFYPLSSLPAYQHLGPPKIQNVNSYDISARGINLPGAANLGEKEIDKITDAIKAAIWL